MPYRPGMPNAVIAKWGDVALVPLDSESTQLLASPQIGFYVDFLGNLKRSAQEGLPIYVLGGSAGTIYQARDDGNGKGVLRISAIDASKLTLINPRPSQSPTTPPPPPEPRSPPTPSPPTPSPGGVSSGSGFYVTHDGFVLTNFHVVKDCTEIQLRTNLGTFVSAILSAKDPTNDLALLKIEATPDKVAAFRLNPRLGEAVEAFGYPLTGLLATSGNFSAGNITALAGVSDDSRYLQISVPVQPGNSGGPLLDQQGNLVGIVLVAISSG